jgi:hypothetical protein
MRCESEMNERRYAVAIELFELGVKFVKTKKPLKGLKPGSVRDTKPRAVAIGIEAVFKVFFIQ